MLLYLIRHGDPDYARDCLTPRGRLQAEAVAKRLANCGVDRVYSSPLGRARETAQPTCDLLDLPCTVEPWAYEVDWDEVRFYSPDAPKKTVWELKNTEILADGARAVSYEDSLTVPAIRDSGLRLAQERVSRGINELLERHGYREENGLYRVVRPNEERVALFAHGGFGLVALSVLMHMPIHLAFAELGWSHTGVTVISFENDPDGLTAPRLLCFSDISHLFAAGLDMKYCNGSVI